jgi:phosphate:Na+ symporter
LTVLLALLAGVALFAYGLTLTAGGLHTLTRGPLLEAMLARVRNRFAASLLGLAATVLAGSSSAVSVLSVGLVGANLMELPQALAVLLGASVGTTVTIQLVSLDMVRFAPLLLVLGVVLTLIERRRTVQGSGSLVLGFGILFYAISVMTESAHAVAGLPGASRWIASLTADPVVPLAAGFVLTALVQNSATTIALALAFSLRGALGPESALMMVLGANLGSPAAAVYAGLGGGGPARRSAAGYVIMKAAAVGLALLLLHPLLGLLRAVDPTPGRLVANAHTVFNLGMAVIFLPLTGPVATLVTRAIHPSPSARRALAPPVLDPALLAEPSAALRASAREVARMAGVAAAMVEVLPSLLARLGTAPRRFLEQEETVDYLHQAVHSYLSRLADARLSRAERDHKLRLLAVANQLEHVGDTLEKLSRTAAKLGRRGYTWPPGLQAAVDAYVTHAVAWFDQAARAVAAEDDAAARRVVLAYPDLAHEEVAIRRQAFEQVGDVPGRSTMLELLDDLAVLSQRTASLGRALLGFQ